MLVSYSVIFNIDLILRFHVLFQFLIVFNTHCASKWPRREHLARIIVVCPSDRAVTDLLLLLVISVLSCLKRVCDEAKLITQFQSQTVSSCW